MYSVFVIIKYFISCVFLIISIMCIYVVAVLSFHFHAIMADNVVRTWSSYANDLPTLSKERYKSKLTYNDGTRYLPDPYVINEWIDDPTKWPDVTFTDIYFYLIDTPGLFTHQSMRAFKSLKAYEYVQSGHVHPIMYNEDASYEDFCFLKTKVIPSQRLRDKPHQPWVCLTKRKGSIYCAHCTCMAGLGEVCSHVAALLFKVDAAVKAGLTLKSCTSEACKWNSAYRKELTPVAISDEPLFVAKRTKPIESTSATGKAVLPSTEVLQTLKEVCPNAVFFKSIPPLDCEETDSADETVDYSSFPPPLTTLQCEPGDVDEDTQLSELCESKWKHYSCTSHQITNLEKQTRNQSVSPLWYEHRKGRITGTSAHSVLVMKDTTDPTNCIKQILGYSKDISKVKAVSWGIDNETKARNCYISKERTKHVNFSCRLSGINISKKKVFLGASADGVVCCDCCGYGCLEIKCPYKYRNNRIIEAVQDPTFCLDNQFNLKQGHKYFTQIQLQMFVHDVSYCDFVIFTLQDLVVTRILRNDEFCNNLISRCELFFHKYLLPELILCKIGNAVPKKPVEVDVNNLWCVCREEEYGRMIKCDGANCPFEWFHYKCVDVRKKPIGSWFCMNCK